MTTPASPDSESAFALLSRFLASTDEQVGGHAAHDPGDELRPRLARFASGQSSPDERAELCRVLAEHPGYLEYLAALIKQRRSPER